MNNSETQPNQHQTSLEAELDIRDLCRSLWQGKIWIVACAVIFAAIALGASYFMQPKWSTTAITDLPTVNNLGSYYSQQQFLRNLDSRINAVGQEGQLPTIAKEAYEEFTKQLGSYDTRRQFWLGTEYYKQRLENDPKADAALLDELINNIEYTPADALKNPTDSVKLVAETATDSNQLLREYIEFANQRATTNLNDELKGTWATKTQSMKALVKREAMVATAAYDRRLNSLEQALKVAEKQGILRNQTTTPVDEIPDSKMFMLGVPLLQAQIETLKATGPDFDTDYDQNVAMLSTLNVEPVLQDNFHAYRYLRTPEDPIKRDSPRRAFITVLWGAIGMLVGAGVVLSRRRPS
ncbi:MULTISPECIES: ECA polysaccharide chain length modulation protein [Providencia]|uniref:ECA polysaccharide chain length modulation protein n=1 Tax=Providencia TaxID=586 RepID=UPI00234BBB96|nr:ECA polysaccharide chain length modulation protein [Providencia sp. PROV212]MDR2241705.1 ECA polysaccharide chain length modulation protein [Providencia alcalifaciens]MDR2989954.1 ECA polysaccharide chain length modulation protein [Providencia alcalifaciens]